MKGFYSLVGLMLLVRGASAEFFDDGTSKARITIRVMDEEGKAMARAHTGFGFNLPKPAGGLEYVDKSGIADRNGLFTATGRTMEHITFASLKDGYYRSEGEYTFQNAVRGRWQPWDVVVTQVLRQVVNPIPMYAKIVNAHMPVLDESVGYDLMRGDWMPPYGKGEVQDIGFCMKKRYVDMRNFDSSLEVTLTNSGDGLQETSLNTFEGSAFRLLRSAPLDGYVITSIRLCESSTNYFSPNENHSYYFRLRTRTNEPGEVTSAFYGKIRGYIGFDVRHVRTGVVRFTYYLNPTPNDRNLEFDPKRNLFTNLKRLEDVNAP